MRPPLSNRFLLLDFGHPMNNNTVKIIKKSLENILVLAATFPGNLSLPNFGFSVINSEFTVIESVSNLRNNYNSVAAKLESLDEIPEINVKVTVQQYKQLLKSSVEAILREFEMKFQKVKQGNNFLRGKEARFQITVVTKKKASLLKEILADVIKKLPDISIENFKIIQVVNEEDKHLISQERGKWICWKTCLDNKHDMDCIFKDWLLRPEREQQQLGIILSENNDLIITCDVDDCIVDLNFSPPARKFPSHEDFLRKALSAIPPLEIVASDSNLKILNRIPVSGLCPTHVFGIPRRAYASNDFSSSPTDSQINQKIFKELCRELLRTEQGLLAELNFRSGTNEINARYFITSDGMTLLLSCVVPDELYLPQRLQSTKPDHEIHQYAAWVVKSSLRKIQFLEEYSPSDFSSGLYDHLKIHLKQTVKKSSLLGHIDPDLLPSDGNLPPKTLKPRKKSYMPFLKALVKETVEPEAPKSQNEGNRLKRKKSEKSEEEKNVHPALLSPKIVQRYRKINPSVFHFPELDQPLD